MEKTQFYHEARRGDGPLAGVRVLEATTTWAGPMCGCLLADLGAEVVKVEAPAGEIARRSPPFLPGSDPPVSFMHATVNRNKRSLALDLHHPEARDLFLSLATRSDVVVENFRPGTADRFGIGYPHVRDVRPDVIYVSISGFGQWGPDHDQPGYDPLAQARSGFLSLNGDPTGPPVKAPTFLGDDLGGLHAALGVLAALHHRDRTGEGQHLDVSLLDAMLFQSTGYLTLGALGVELPRLGNEFRIAAPANTYRCRDGHLMAGVLLDRHWRLLTVALGRPELAEHPDYATAPARISHRREVNELLASFAESRSVEEAVGELTAAGVPAAPVLSYQEAARDPHVAEREMLQSTALPGGGEAPLVGPPVKFSRTPTRVRSGPAELGAHTDELLDELGLDADAIRRLREGGVVA
ncbi:MAG: CoA transferase [Myxococcota bacterium]